MCVRNYEFNKVDIIKRIRCRDLHNKAILYCACQHDPCENEDMDTKTASLQPL